MVVTHFKSNKLQNVLKLIFASFLRICHFAKIACTKNVIYTIFTLCEFHAKKVQTTVKSRAKMVNTAFANAVFTIFAVEFPPVCTMLHHICRSVSQSK